MAGNIWEWVIDEEGKYAIRGGSFSESLIEARSSFMKKMDPQERSNDIGFRIVQEIPL